MRQKGSSGYVCCCTSCVCLIRIFLVAVGSWIGLGVYCVCGCGCGSWACQFHVSTGGCFSLLQLECGLNGRLQSSNSIQAFQEAANVVRGLVDGSVSSGLYSICSEVSGGLRWIVQVKLDEPVIEAAKSSIVYNVAKGVSTPGRAVSI
jgi:hypothetical protein